jgi:hypothetical protein
MESICRAIPFIPSSQGESRSSVKNKDSFFFIFVALSHRRHNYSEERDNTFIA